MCNKRSTLRAFGLTIFGKTGTFFGKTGIKITTPRLLSFV